MHTLSLLWFVSSTMEYLHEKNLVEPLRERIANDQPTFLVCVGLQILSEHSEETPETPGLGVFSGVPCVRFPPAVRVPQQAWNVVTANDSCKFLKTGNAYFSNSYCLRSVPIGWHAATSEHGVVFVSALEHGKVVATQFHPELSGSYGLSLMKRWIISSLGLRVPPSPSPFYANAEAVKRQRIAAGREMLHRVIPCLDVRDGRVVKGVKFSGLQDAGDPVQLALEYERQGADEIVMLDITATKEKRQAAMDTVSALSCCLSIPLTVGGGVRCLGTFRN
jgi:imidazole glycerol phosphate synthase glutamine amidotransferase subunit